MPNFFEIFSLKKTFDIDLEALKRAHQDQVVKFHPDKFATANEEEKKQSLQNTSLINTGFDVLSQPLERANYLLELSGINAFDEKDTQMDVEFLMKQIELQEELSLIKAEKDALNLDGFLEKINQLIQENIQKIKENFQKNALSQVKNLVRELKFYTQLQSRANTLMDELL
jgi:molecular chaperone HscB